MNTFLKPNLAKISITIVLVATMLLGSIPYQLALDPLPNGNLDESNAGVIPQILFITQNVLTMPIQLILSPINRWLINSFAMHNGDLPPNFMLYSNLFLFPIIFIFLFTEAYLLSSLLVLGINRAVQNNKLIKNRNT